MKKIKKPAALLFSVVFSVALILTSCNLEDLPDFPVYGEDEVTTPQTVSETYEPDIIDETEEISSTFSDAVTSSDTEKTTDKTTTTEKTTADATTTVTTTTTTTSVTTTTAAATTVVTTTPKPAATTTQPIVTTTKPVVTTTKPAVTTAKPAVTTTQPIVTTPKPAVTTTKPAVTTTKTPPAAGVTYVLNMNSHKFHRPTCPSVNKMKLSNRWDFTGTREEVIAMGYDPCKNCKP